MADFTAAGPEIDVGTELNTSEYLVFLLSSDTYLRYLREHGIEPAPDSPEGAHMIAGVQLLRAFDRVFLEPVTEHLKSLLPTDGQKKMVEKGARQILNREGLSMRAFLFRTALERGGASTVSAIFKTNKYKAAVRSALSASVNEDADAALDVFKEIPLTHAKVRGWIDDAARLAVSEPRPQNPVAAAANVTSDKVPPLVASQVGADANNASSEKNLGQKALVADTLTDIQQSATEEAKKAIQKSGQEDSVVTKSEAMGIAAAMVAAQASNSDSSLPPAIRRLQDAEQRDVAMASGRVVVQATAGAGKTTTLVSMLQYLVEDKKVPPERVFVGVFNVKAADTIVGRAKRLMGDETVKKMTLGTMHSRFLQAILKYGTADQREAFTRRLVSDRSKKTPNPFITPAQLNGVMVAIWKECYPNKQLPKGVSTAMEKWKFNNLTPDQALAQALDPNEESLAIWYQWQMGFKGLLGTNWAPPCVGTQVPRFDNRGLPVTDNKAASKWWGFLARYRTDTSGGGGIGSKTLADHTDMILQFRDLLRDNPSARKAIQDQFDYILFDEAQDLSAVAHQIADLMSEKIDVDSKDKALMFIGDVTQAVNAFVGGSPKHMAKRYEDGFTLKTIRTNHRCLPEIVEASQRLLSNHPKSIPFEAQADPAKPRGEASIRVMTVRDQSVAAQNLLSEWQSKVSIGGDWSDFAVLSRTRRELDTYELGCIVNGVPYSRKGGGSFLQSSEMLTVMGYMNVVTSSDYVAVRKSLGKVLNTPNRFFLTGDKKPEEMVEQAANALARSRGVGLDQLDPMELFNSNDGVDELLNVIFPNGEKMRLERGPMAWKLDKAREQIENLGQTIGYLRTKVQKEGKPDDKGDIKYPTSRLLDDILMIEGVPEGPKGNQKAVTVKDVLIPPMRALEDESAATEVMDPEEAALGTVFFLKVIAEGAAGAVKQGFNPVAPDDFMGYMKKLYTEAKDLRVDVNEWDEEQAALYPDEPEKRKKAPAVTLSTIHCSPPDEPVLTTEGWVSISQLDPEKHRLASYIQKCNQAVWGKNTPGGNREGYPFLLASQAYEGRILTLRTERSKTRVTPNHKVLVRFSPNFNDKYIVYLMRRGNWWRIGLCVSARRPYKAAGVACRLATEQADAGWILGVYNTREEALVAESCFQGKYGILGLTFQSSKGRSLTANQLHEIHDSVKAESTDRAKKLLLDAGLDILDPLYRRNATDSDMERINMRGGFLTSSCNVLSGYMEVSVPTQAFVTKEGSSEEIMKPEWLPVSVSSESYNGDVYSMVVMPHRTYISGGMVVGNSVKGAEWNSVAVVMTHGTFPMAPRKIPGEEKLSPEKQAILAQRREDDFLTERQLAYVGMTRAGSNLTVISQNRDSKGRVIPPSSFIIEAGLVDGENVTGQPAPLPPAPVKTASIYVEGDLWQT